MKLLRLSLPTLFILFILLCRYNAAWAEWYARQVYPTVSGGLSAFSSLFPFSLEEVFVVGVIGWMIVYPFLKRKRGGSWRSILGHEVEVIAWVYIWFYLAWGLNYFRYNVYTRLQTPPVEYNEQQFLSFLERYTDSLNTSYLPPQEVEADVLEAEVKAFYRNLPSSVGLAVPRDCQVPKQFILTPLYSGVGVLGSMGPFFAEAQLNADLLPVQLPFTYAHEFSHLLGVSGEAEANYWAFLACTGSSHPQMRFSGYFGLLPYVLINARALLTEEQYKEWAATIRPEVIEVYNTKRTYWQEKYSPWIGEVQDFFYNLFLKGNRIPSGKKNYAEVIGILLAVEK